MEVQSLAVVTVFRSRVAPMDEKVFVGDLIVGLEQLVNKSVQHQPGHQPVLFGGKAGEAVPEVNPEDLKSLWKLQHDRGAMHLGREHAIGIDVAQQICKAGADMQALFYRSTLLWLMERMASEQFAPFTKDGQPIDAAFSAAAKVPAEWMGGEIRQRPPFNPDEFVRLCNEGQNV